MAKSFDELANRTMSPQLRARAGRRTREIVLDMLLREVRTQAGKSQTQLAQLLRIKQPTLSKLEGQKDMQISTLQKIISALGGEVEIIAHFPNAQIRLSQFHPKSYRPGRVTQSPRIHSPKLANRKDAADFVLEQR
jgi:transcriptional regulator with XRE-family HTH domain